MRPEPAMDMTIRDALADATARLEGEHDPLKGVSL